MPAEPRGSRAVAPVDAIAAIRRATLCDPPLVRRCGGHVVAVFPGREGMPGWHDLVRSAGSRLRLVEARWPQPIGWQLELRPARWRITPDQLAMRPIFSATDEGGDGYLATRPEWLAAILERELDPDAVVEQLALSFMLGRRSPWRGIERLEAGDALHGEGRRIVRERCDLALESPWPASASDVWWPEQLVRIGADAASAIEAGATLQLTGGHDSRLVLALALSHGVRPRTALTVGRSEDEDVRIAAVLCRRLGIEHVVVPPEADPVVMADDAREHAADSGFAVNAVEFAWMRTCLRASARRCADAAKGSGGVPMRVGGLGGETAGGFYDTPFDAAAARSTTVRRAFVRRRLLFGASDCRALLDDRAGRTHLQAMERIVLASIDARAGTFRERLDRFYVAERMRQWAGASLHASMRVIDGVEPLLAQAFRTWGRRERALGRDPRTSQRALVRRLAPDLAAVPWTGVPAASDRKGPRASARAVRAWRTGGRIARRLRGGPGRPQLGAADAAALLAGDPAVRDALEAFGRDVDLAWRERAPLDAARIATGRPRALGVLLTAAWGRQETQLLARDMRRTAPAEGDGAAGPDAPAEPGSKAA